MTSAKEAMDSLQDWSLKAATLRVERPWCMFGLDTQATPAAIAALFDRSVLVKEYIARYNELAPKKKKPHSYLQSEINLLYGMHKAFVARHRTRLETYRDDASQKGYHTRRTVTRAMSKFSTTQAKAEEL